MNKEKQIEEMAKVIASVPPIEFPIGSRMQGRHIYTATKIAEHLYNADYRKQEWISVEDRLPESGVSCLLCCDVKRYDGTHRQYICDGFHAERWKEECSNCGDDCAVEYNEENDEYYLCEGWYELIKNWDDYTSIAIADTITHWMPLPEAPKMKGGAE